MKNVIWAIVALIVALAALAEVRYTVIVNPPIVAKADRLTGDVWIANAGQWIKIQDSGVTAENPLARLQEKIKK